MNTLQDNIKKIKEAKYKLVILLLLIIAYIVYPYYQDINNRLINLKQTLKTKESVLTKLRKEKKQIENIKSKISYIEENKRKIVDCINNKNWDFNKCWLNLASDDVFLVKSYLMFHKFSKTEKMDYNQKRILSDILFYLEWRGQLDIVSFGNVRKLSKTKQIYSLPITLWVTFKNYKQLLNFLDAVENKVNTSRDLFVIKNLNYDILNPNKPQYVTLNTDVLFYK